MPFRRPVTQCSAGAHPERVFLGVQSTVKVSEGGGCACSAGLHQAHGPLLLVLPFAISAGLKLPQKCGAVEEEFSNRDMGKKRKYGNKENNPLKFKISRVPHLQLSLNKESLF